MSPDMHQSSPESDWLREAVLVFERITKAPLAHIERLKGGSINRVFSCTSTHGEQLVLRLVPWSQKDNRRGAAEWTRILADAGTGVVPYTATARDGDPAPCFWMAMPFVEGTDLAKALPGMSAEQQRRLAHELFTRQNLAVPALAAYSHGDCGRALRPEARWPAHANLSWGQYLVHEFTWRLKRIHKADCGPDIYRLLEQVLEALKSRSGLVVTNEGFMYDIADRNVMVDKGALVGIIDQDCVFFGDRLLAPALAWAALQATESTSNSAFAEHWQTLEMDVPNSAARWQSVCLFCAGWIASQTGSVAQNGEACLWEPELAVKLLKTALA